MTARRRKSIASARRALPVELVEAIEVAVMDSDADVALAAVYVLDDSGGSLEHTVVCLLTLFNALLQNALRMSRRTLDSKDIADGAIFAARDVAATTEYAARVARRLERAARRADKRAGAQPRASKAGAP